jgi:RNA-directed DNA polymerase
MQNRVITSAVREESEKLIRRHDKYLSNLALTLERKEKRSGVQVPKIIHRPAYWSADNGFNPYYVRPRAENIAYAIDKALSTGRYQPRPAAKYLLPKAGGGERELSVFQVADNAVSNLTFDRLIEKNARHFSAHAYAYRRDLTVHDAVLHVVSDFRSKSRIFRRILKDQRFFLTERELRVD